MKFLNRFIIILSSLLIVSLGSAKSETLEDIAAELNDLKESISNLDTSEVKEAIVIDKALNEITKVVNFVNDKVNTGDIEAAVVALNFADKAMSDIATSTLPKEFETEVIKKGEDFSAEQMAEIMDITINLDANKNVKTQKLVQDMVEASVNGLDTITISKSLNEIGIKTINSDDIVKAILQAEQASAGRALRRATEINEELEDQARFGAIIGTSAEEVDFALRQVEVLREGDPRKIRALEIEKYGKLLGISEDKISKGIQAVYSGDIEVEKQISKEILQAANQSPDWEVSIEINDAVMNDIAAEDVAIEKAVYAIMNSKALGALDTSAYKEGVVVHDVSGYIAAQKEHSRTISEFADEIGTLLANTGTIDDDTIRDVKYQINRQGVSGLKPETIASMVMAELQGDEYKSAYYAVDRSFIDFEKRGTQTLAYTAAHVEAILSGDPYAHTDAAYSDEYAVKLTDSQKAEISKVYDNALDQIDKKNSVIALEAIKQTTQMAAETSLKAALINAQYESLETDYEQKKQELEVANKIYAEALEDQKEGEKSLQQVLELQRTASKKSNEFFNVSQSYSNAKKVVDAAELSASFAKVSMNKATQNAAMVGVSVETIKKTVSVTAEATSAAALKAAQKAAAVKSQKVTEQAAAKTAGTAGEAAAAKVTAAEVALEAAKVASTQAQAATQAATAAVNFPSLDLAKTIKAMNPSAQFSYSGEDVSSIKWLGGTTPISAEAILAKQTELTAQYGAAAGAVAEAAGSVGKKHEAVAVAAARVAMASVAATEARVAAAAAAGTSGEAAAVAKAAAAEVALEAIIVANTQAAIEAAEVARAANPSAAVNFPSLDLAKTIKAMNPSAQFSYSGEDVSSIKWLGGTTPISAEAILAKQTELTAQYGAAAGAVAEAAGSVGKKHEAVAVAAARVAMASVAVTEARVAAAADLNNSQKLTEQFNKKIESVSKQINTINSQASSLTSKVDVLTEEINTKTLETNEFNKQVASLNSQLQNSTNLINSKQTALSQLQNSLAPTQDQFNKKIKSVSKQINTINSQASSLTSKVDVLTEEINTKTLETNEFNKQVASLNSQLQNSTNLINSKQTALSQLQNSLAPVQDQLLALNKERDIINEDFDRVLSKEVHDFNKFQKFIGNSEEDVVMALRQVDALLESDPRKSRAFEYEVYAKKFDVPKDKMQMGIESILSGDYGGEKTALADVYTRIVDSNVTRIGKNDISQEAKNALKNNPALITQIADESAKTARVTDTAIYKILDAAKNGIDPNRFRANFDPATKERFANQIKGILMSDPNLANDGHIDRVYYDLLYNGPTTDVAALAQIKLSDDATYERAYWTAQYASSTYNDLDESKIRVAAEVNVKLNGGYQDERDFWNVSFNTDDKVKMQSFSDQEREEYINTYGQFLGNTSEKFVSVNNKISEFETVNATSLKEVNALSKEIEDVQTAEKQLQSQIVSLNTQIKENQNTISANKTSLNGLEQQHAKFTTELQALNSNKNELSMKLDEQTVSSMKKVNALSKEIEDAQTAEKQLQNQIVSLNTQIKENQNTITATKTSINGLEQQHAKFTTELQSLNINKNELSIKLDEQTAKVAVLATQKATAVELQKITEQALINARKAARPMDPIAKLATRVAAELARKAAITKATEVAQAANPSARVNFPSLDLAKTIRAMDPTAQFGYSGEDVSSIKWYGGTTPISAEAILAKQAELTAQYGAAAGSVAAAAGSVGYKHEAAATAAARAAMASVAATEARVAATAAAGTSGEAAAVAKAAAAEVALEAAKVASSQAQAATQAARINFPSLNLAKTIKAMNPSAQFGYSGEDVSSIKWYGGTTPIDVEAILAKQAELTAQYGAAAGAVAAAAGSVGYKDEAVAAAAAQAAMASVAATEAQAAATEAAGTAGEAIAVAKAAAAEVALEAVVTANAEAVRHAAQLAAEASTAYGGFSATEHIDLAKTIKSMNPAAEFSYGGEDVSSIQWLGGTEAISAEAILAKQAELRQARSDQLAAE